MTVFTTQVINNASGRFELPIVLPITLYDVSGQTITFTNAGATGRLGPTLAQCRSSYTGSPGFSDWGNDTNLFYVDQGVQYWKVPATGSYTITAAGAGGGGTNAGRGAIISGSYSLRAGDILRIVVGQPGINPGSNRGGGGGASCVSRVFLHSGAQQLLIIAGGGAGSSDNDFASGNQTRRDAQAATNTSVPAGGEGSHHSTAYSSPQISTYWGGGGGGGWADSGDRGGIGNGQYTGSHNNEGNALSAVCPYGGNSESGAFGGFGGGGGTGRDSAAGGGGGGWKGGNAQNSAVDEVYENSTYRGGESYSLNGITTVGSGGTGRTGNGYISIACP